MNVTTTNIANMNTPGYARRRVIIEQAPSTGDDSAIGVDVKSVESLRDNILDLSINAATSRQRFSSTVSSSLSTIELSFSDTASGSIGSTVDAFFSSLQSLSTTPADSSLRSSVLTAAGNVATAFQKTASAVADTQQQMDRCVVQDTASINSILQQIAATNTVISQASNIGQSANDAQDQQSALLTELSALIDFKTINSSDGLTLTTSNGTSLIVGSKAYLLTNALNANGFNDVYAGGVDITSTIQGGSLAGELQTRDETLATMNTQLDQFAFQFAQAVNNVQAAGSDANGSTGAAMFDPPDTTSGTSTGAASSMKVSLTRGSQIAAAASGGASGDNSNIAKMIALQNQSIVNGATPSTAFSNLSYYIGNTISQANTEATATTSILTQLKNQQGSVEGVSLDEEASNLLLYQRAFQAAAKVISTIDTLMGNILDMGANNPGY